MNTKQRVKERMEVLGVFYNFDEVFGHLTFFKPENEKHLDDLSDEELDERIDSACNIIDLNNEEEE